MTNKNFKNKVVVITGGSRGIGYATVKTFLEEGAIVCFCSKNKKNLKKAEAELKKYGQVMAEVVDVREMKQVKKFIERIIKKYNQIDVLINNAAVIWQGNFYDEEQESIDAMIDTNIKGYLYVARLVLPDMIKRGAGTIINIASEAGQAGIRELATYCATKFAICGFAETLDLEVRNLGIKVYALCPGAVDTDMQFQVSGRHVGIPPEKVAKRILAIVSGTEETGKCLGV